MTTNKWVWKNIGSNVILKNIILERKVHHFGHVKTPALQKQLNEGVVEGRRGRTRTSNNIDEIMELR